ncbi:putative DNA helicase [Lupinus albus]|uniref:Putative DNA helicase n=1 Tax=Lupinus albus TaxID=3870 RepID=A0A6A4NJJ1_LUPAL|nr:putative DNA helicase [Lupinus albus]
MGGNNVSSDQVIAEMLEMGFEYSSIVEAITIVGPSITSVVDHILNGASVGSRTNCEASSSTSTAINSKIHANNGKVLKKRTLRSSSGQVRQSRMIEHFQLTNDKVKESKNNDVAVDAVGNGEEHKEPFSKVVVDPCVMPGSVVVDSEDDLDVAYDWEKKAGIILQKHFGFSSLKSFQKKALNAWFAHKDCLVLAATGSGKSLCFQLPALLTGKVVVVISPLISLMHDQCLKLARHGISACFLGSGQPDNTVEQKAMRGMYSIIYVCPETIQRLITPLQELAENRGIALFAIDEVHCVSKWGHDFRPDYRRLSVLREKFSTSKLKSLKYDIPLMALTATATKKVREDILKSLCLSKDTNVVLTSFFRSNLRFTVKHSRKSLASYDKDFHKLIEIYGRKQYTDENKRGLISKDSDNVSNSDTDDGSPYDKDDNQDDYADRDINVVDSGNRENIRKGKELSVEFLENDIDDFQCVDDWDVTCGEFCAQPPPNGWESSEIIDPPKKPGGRLRILKETVQKGPTIIYVPTRKETVKIANYLCKFGVKAAAYNAGLPKSHLRRVHMEFHQNNLEVWIMSLTSIFPPSLLSLSLSPPLKKRDTRFILELRWPIISYGMLSSTFMCQSQIHKFKLYVLFRTIYNCDFYIRITIVMKIHDQLHGTLSLKGIE